MSKLECKDLSKSFSISGDTIEVINNINLSITEGDKVAITGKSGAGKSTLLQILASLDSPTSGRVYLDKTDFASLSNDGLSQIRLHNFGFVYQFHHLLEEFSALENVALPLLIAGQSMTSAKETSAKFLTSIGLEGRLGHRPSQLSGGERQRIAVIRGLINKPSVLLLDEPTGNLDSDSAKKTLDLILQLSKTLSMAIVLVTHDTFVAKNMDVTYRLMDGRLEEK